MYTTAKDHCFATRILVLTSGLVLAFTMVACGQKEIYTFLKMSKH